LVAQREARAQPVVLLNSRKERADQQRDDVRLEQLRRHGEALVHRFWLDLLNEAGVRELAHSFENVFHRQAGGARQCDAVHGLGLLAERPKNLMSGVAQLGRLFGGARVLTFSHGTLSRSR
jgi:hypothetical protein